MYQLQSFSKNEKGRDFIVGDIHGMYDALMQLLESVNFDKNIDRLFSVGDLIDRGPKSFDMLRLTYQPWFHAALGNHEIMLLTGHLSYSKDWFSHLNESDKKECLSIIKTLPIAIEVETDLGLIGLVHAQVPIQFNDWNAFKQYLASANLSYEMSSVHDSGSVIRDALWSRKRIYTELKKNGTTFARKAYIKFIKDGLWNRTTLYRIITTRKTLPYIKHGISFSFRYLIDKFKRKLHHQSYIDNVKYTFHGHTPVKKPLLLGNQFFIDTGAVYGMRKNKQGSLTLIEVADDLKVHTLRIDI